jgi:glucose/arabinose dehydrogenase
LRLLGNNHRPLIHPLSRRRVLSGLLLGLLFLSAGVSAAQPIGSVRVADGLTAPTYVVAPPEDFNRLFVLLQGGEILIMDLTTGSIAGTPFLDVTVGGEGLQGLAFHPSYRANGFFYVYYTTGFPAHTVVERYTRDAVDPNLADEASALRIIEIPQPYPNHNGGWIGFGPDGYLYVPLGDGGSQCDPSGHGQDTDTLLSSLLRLDVDGDDFPTDADRNYAIPADNPFVGQPGAAEIWSYGLRNPFRASFDRLTGDLYIGDVGQSTREEIDFQPAASTGGENWGWDLREGFIATPTQGTCVGGPPPAGNADPIYDYSHGAGDSQGNSVTGGYVYRGPGADLQGKYFFGDFVNERIWSIDAVTGANITDWTTTFVPDVGTISDIVSFGEDGAGYLYIVDLGFDVLHPGGEIFRVVGPFPFVPCPDLVLEHDAVVGDRIEEHCRNITVGPDFVVGGGGDLTLRAGNRVNLGDGTTIATDGRLIIEIDTSLQLTPP